MTVLALKLFLAPGFIVVASLVARRFGVRVAGILAGLPVIAGPILLVLALDRGHVFTAKTAAGNTLGIVALMVFVLAYAAVAPRLGWALSVLVSWGAFGLAMLALVPVRPGATVSFLVACLACTAALRVLPKPDPREQSAAAHPRWDLPVRASCAVVPVLAVTGAASALGPHTSGLLSAFPIIVPVLTAFTHAHAGPREAVRLLRGFTIGFYAYALFCFTVAVTIEHLGTAATFSLAAALALATQGAAVVVAYRREPDAIAGVVEG